MERLVVNFERIYCTKFKSLEEHELYLVKSVIFITDFFVTRVGILGMALIPVLALGIKEWRPIHTFLLLWGTCESWFLIYQVSKQRILEKRELGLCDSVKRSVAIEKILEHLGDPEDSAEQLLKKWQLEEAEFKPCMAHFVESLVWMFFNKPVEALTTKESLESKLMLHRFREKLNIPTIHHGKQGARIKCIRFSIDHLNYAYKSLLFYLATAVPRFLMLGYLWLRGFHFSSGPEKRHTYWVKIGKVKDDPLVVSTGFGIGIVTYLFLINEILCQHPNRTVILFETPFVNLHPTAPTALKQATILEVDDMLSQLNIANCTWLGHSFGTIIAGWIVQHRPHYISKLILVDPVCFRMWDTTSYRALLYQTPDSLETAMLQTLFSSDSIVAYGIGRHMDWFECLLFPDQIAMPTQIFTATNDFFTTSAGLCSYLQHRIAKDNLSHINLTTMNTSHGLFQALPDLKKKVVGAL